MRCYLLPLIFFPITLLRRATVFSAGTLQSNAMTIEHNSMPLGLTETGQTIMLNTKPIQVLHYLVCVLVGLSMLLAIAYAGEECPSTVSPYNPRQTQTDYKSLTLKRYIGWDEIITVEAYSASKKKKMRFRMPFGYSSSQFLDIEPSQGIQTGMGFGIKFWMPDKRYVERIIEMDLFHPCENGRPPPTADQYLVSGAIWPLEKLVWRNSAEIYETPQWHYDRDIENHRYNSGEKAVLKYGLIYNKRYFWSQDYKNGKEISRKKLWEHYYRHEEGAAFQAYFKCVGMCVGWFYYPDRDLHFSVFFPHQYMMHWRDMVETYLAYVDKFHVKTYDVTPEMLAADKAAWQRLSHPPSFWRRQFDALRAWTKSVYQRLAPVKQQQNHLLNTSQGD